MKSLRYSILFGIVAAILFESSARGQFLPPPPKPYQGFSTAPFVPASVMPQTAFAPIPSSFGLVPRPIGFRPITPIGGFFGGFPIYPSFGYGFGGYGYQPNINQNVNINLTIVPNEYGSNWRSWANPIEGLPPAPATNTNTAKLSLQVPVNAEVYLNDKKTEETGTLRVYESPQLTGGKQYKFDVRIVWTENGKQVEEKRQLTMSANESRTLIFLAAPTETTRLGN
jgi:uncharacterized protein (TIGR03000 family)